LAARLGRVAMRALGTCSAPRRISASRMRASSRFLDWSRKRLAWITRTPSAVMRRSRRDSTRSRTASGSDGERATSKRSSTALATLLTFWPPGPPARTKLSISSSSPIWMRPSMSSMSAAPPD